VILSSIQFSHSQAPSEHSALLLSGITDPEYQYEHDLERHLPIAYPLSRLLNGICLDCKFVVNSSALSNSWVRISAIPYDRRSAWFGTVDSLLQFDCNGQAHGHLPVKRSLGDPMPPYGPSDVTLQWSWWEEDGTEHKVNNTTHRIRVLPGTPKPPWTQDRCGPGYLPWPELLELSVLLHDAAPNAALLQHMASSFMNSLEFLQSRGGLSYVRLKGLFSITNGELPRRVDYKLRKLSSRLLPLLQTGGKKPIKANCTDINGFFCILCGLFGLDAEFRKFYSVGELELSDFSAIGNPAIVAKGGPLNGHWVAYDQGRVIDMAFYSPDKSPITGVEMPHYIRMMSSGEDWRIGDAISLSFV
jgi:hypothetical protein